MEVDAVGDPHRAAGASQGGLAFQRKRCTDFRGGLWGSARAAWSRGRAVRQMPSENVEIQQRGSKNGLGCDAKFCARLIRRRMSNKIRNQKRIELRAWPSSKAR